MDISTLKMYGKGKQEIHEAKTNGRQTNLWFLTALSYLIDYKQISKDIDILTTLAMN